MIKCCRSFILEFHYSKFSPFHPNWKAFTYTPWLPYKWSFQAIYLAYRWIIALYFLAWLITSGVSFEGSTYLTFLTNWGFITYNAYLLIAALSTTTKYLTVHFICPSEKYNFSRSSEFEIKKPSGCCGYADNKLSWYQMVHWVFFTIGNELAFVILLLYWILLYRGQSVNGVNANTHLVNGLVAVVDLWVSGVPVNFLHFIYLSVYGIVYSIFTGIYFAASGEIVYGILDYENAAGLAIGILVAVVLVVLPLVHIVVFYLLYLAKYWILYCLFGRNINSEEVKVDLERDGSGESLNQQ